jgi:hypothetical protein
MLPGPDLKIAESGISVDKSGTGELSATKNLQWGWESSEKI